MKAYSEDLRKEMIAALERDINLAVTVRDKAS